MPAQAEQQGGRAGSGLTPADPPLVAVRRFGRDLGEVGAARAWIGEMLAQRDLLGPDETGEVLVAVSELVGNVLAHTDSQPVVAIGSDETRIRVEVRDEAQERPYVVAPGSREIGGLGLRLVDELSESWGINGLGTGKAVWFTVARS